MSKHRGFIIIDSNYGIDTLPLHAVIEELKIIGEKHPKAYFEFREMPSNHGYSFTQLRIVEDVEESDEDYAARLKQEAESIAARLKAEEEAEKRMWEALKAKYGE